MTTKNGGPAFPVTDAPTTHRIGVMAIEGITDSEERDRIYTAATVRAAQGMTLRDYFAAKAIQGLLANPGGPIQANGMNGWNWCNCTVESVADFAWHIADAMLKARETSND